MKIVLFLIFLAPLISRAEAIITVEALGQDWGNLSHARAKENATAQAIDECNGDVELASDWSITVVSRKEGMFLAKATADFRCL